MFAIVGIHVVIGSETSAKANHSGLFAKVEMTVPTNAGFGVHFACFLFEQADEHHLVVVVKQSLSLFAPW